METGLRGPGSRRGASLVLVAISLFALMGMAALAVDLGMLQKARAEAQRAADAAALAGASAWLLDLTVAAESTEAVHRARVAADTNYMNGVKFDSLAELEVWPIVDSQKVRVRVRRAAVPTWFGRVFGINTVAVGARAAAVADYSTGTRCVKPIAVPDLWQDTEDVGYPGGNNEYDPGETWLYSNPPDVYNPAHYAGDGTGTGLGSDLRNTFDFERDWGRLIVLRPAVSEGSPNQPCPGDLQGNKCYVPGWWGLWGGTVPDLRDKILGCDTTVTSVGVTVPVESGWKQTLNNAVLTVYQRDEMARWDPGATDSVTRRTGTVVGSSYGNRWRGSPRAWTMAIVAPADVPQAASDKDVVFNNFMVFFFEGCIDESGDMDTLDGSCGTQDMLLGRFVGLAKGTTTGPFPGTMTRLLRLVE